MPYAYHSISASPPPRWGSPGGAPTDPQVDALRGVLFGDQLHQPGAIPRLEAKVDALGDRLEALAEQLRAQEVRAQMARARWQWMLIGAGAAGALAGGGLWSLLQHLAALA